MNLYTKIQQSVHVHYAKILEYSKKPYMKQLFIIMTASVIVAGGYLVFNWYQKRQNIQAFAGLMEIAKSYEQAVNKARELDSKPSDEQKENPWEDTQLLLEALSTVHSGSSLAPFFVMYQAQLALDAENDYDKACQLMDQGLSRLSKKSIYYDMFNLKRLKMLLDNPMENIRIAALKELETMAYHQENYCAQEALYTIGAYQLYYGNMQAAVRAWSDLVKQGDSEKTLIHSPWITQAQEKLKTLHVSVE